MKKIHRTGEASSSSLLRPPEIHSPTRCQCRVLLPVNLHSHRFPIPLLRLHLFPSAHCCRLCISLKRPSPTSPVNLACKVLSSPRPTTSVALLLHEIIVFLSPLPSRFAFPVRIVFTYVPVNALSPNHSLSLESPSVHRRV
jgi:hypothetical protein